MTAVDDLKKDFAVFESDLKKTVAAALAEPPHDLSDKDKEIIAQSFESIANAAFLFGVSRMLSVVVNGTTKEDLLEIFKFTSEMVNEGLEDEKGESDVSGG